MYGLNVSSIRAIFSSAQHTSFFDYLTYQIVQIIFTEVNNKIWIPKCIQHVVNVTNIVLAQVKIHQVWNIIENIFWYGSYFIRTEVDMGEVL